MEIQKRIIPKKETKVIILDDNILSLSLYAEEFPENFKEITDNINNKYQKDKSNMPKTLDPSGAESVQGGKE